MSRTLIVTLGFCVFTVFAACGGGENRATDAQNSAVNAGRNTPVAADLPATSSNNAVTAGNAAENPVAAARNQKIEAMRRSAADPAAPRADIETLLKTSTRPAPENSEFAVALTDIVVERRTFLKHPILAKVEKVTDGSKTTITLVTTDGRSIDLSEGAIENLSIASSASILKAAGFEVPPAQPSARKPGAANRN